MSSLAPALTKSLGGIVLQTAHRAIAVTWFAALLLVLFGCEGAGKRTIDTPDPLWSSIIAAHTSGPIARRSAIRVVFSRDVVAAARVGKPIEGVLRSDPEIEGSVVFDGSRELTLQPKQALTPGKSYRFTLRAQGLLDVPKSLPDYQFIVQVQTPQFDVRYEGLSTRIGRDDEMVLRGELATADVESATQIEQCLRATYADKSAVVEWQHGMNGNALLHRFTVVGLKRSDRDQTLTIAADGKPIGSTASGTREFSVPAKQVFTLTQLSAMNEASDSTERHIVAYFSDALDPNQDMRGLIRVGARSATPRLRAEGNALHIYVADKTASDEQVVIDGALRNQLGGTLGQTVTQAVTFAIPNPQVRWVGTGVIVPQNSDSVPLSVPFEAVNLRSVRVTAFRVYESNLPQFLQVNRLDGNRELGRVGRYLWRKTLRLATVEASANTAGRWVRYSLDLSELMQKHSTGLVRLQLSFAKDDIQNDCGVARDRGLDAMPTDADTDEQADATMLDQVEYDYEDGEGLNWQERDNPCKAAYYYYGQGVRAARNFLMSNFGILAKRDQHGELLAVVTDLRTAEPLAGAKLTVFNFQNQASDTATTSLTGMARLKTKAAPALLIAEKDNKRGYLKLAPGVALSVSHFDVGGEKVAAGIKAAIYGERGVWRPGDTLHLTFALQDLQPGGGHSLPANHPVTMELFNPQQQLVQSIVNEKPVGGFYAFALQTSPNAPTGDWTAKATLGGNTFTKTVKVETVMPNRLKIDLQMDALNAKRPLRGQLSSQWLTGATAANLHADVKLRLTKATTRFERYDEFSFDDPARDFSGEPETLFDGDLDAQGRAAIDTRLSLQKEAPGMLNATLISRVFERGGAFSISRQAATLSPYDRYVGLKLPKNDGNALVADTTHTVDIATLTGEGVPTDVAHLAVTVYKVDWRWWWDQSGESLAQYTTSTHSVIVQQGVVKSVKGAAQWSFTVRYPEWGRYLIRVCDTEGGHCTGRTVYIDWPYWAGRPQDQSGPGATTLAITADKKEYRVGDVAHIDLPAGTTGRALLTIENGSRILDARWLEVRDGARRVDVPLTAVMTPNVYASVQLLQPHANKQNDRPLRLFGIVPLKVTDPQTRLHPEIKTDKEWRPESSVKIQVSERERRAMHYTLAVVDEGLLGLTNFKTPELHEHFYKREALGVTTWDVFDEVVGGYGANLERLLALGGSDSGSANTERDKSRFPPVVTFVGPFSLAAGASTQHEVKLPQYVGAVRVMLIAGYEGAYGSAEATVPVRQPLMILPTLPRVVGPEEEIAVPISVFATDPSIKDVSVSIQVDDHFQVIGSKTAALKFSQPEEQLALLRVKTAPRVGKARVAFEATSGAHKAKAEIYIDVRSPNPPTVEVVQQALQPGESWKTSVKPHGLFGTNTTTLEVSAVPPLNLESRLEYLIHYPYGCVEQTTSAVFPQLYLPALVKLDDRRKLTVEANVKAGIERLRDFQRVDGGFAYWPGGWTYGLDGQGGIDPRYSWATTYVGHFLLEADKLGYRVPASMLSGWVRYQRNAAQSWTPSVGSTALDQAYRLYTLALSNNAEIGAMNRLRESSSLTTAARWMLAASYKMAGLSEAADALVKADSQSSAIQLSDYPHPDYTFGSRLRDTAVVLNAAVILGKRDTKSLVDAISSELASNGWHSTQTVAYSLLAMSKFVGGAQVGPYTFEQTVVGANSKQSSAVPVYRGVLEKFPDAGGEIVVKNTSSRTLFASVVTRGVPRAGADVAANSGLTLEVKYMDTEGAPLDVKQLSSGTDLIAHVTVKNTQVFEIKNIALAHLVPAGWEIHNDRLDGVTPAGERSQPREEPWYWRYMRSSRKAEYVDIRDDRVYSYFALNPGESIDFVTHINAAYVGRYYLPSVAVEAMYDASKYARSQGQWIEIASGKK